MDRNVDELKKKEKIKDRNCEFESTSKIKVTELIKLRRKSGLKTLKKMLGDSIKIITKTGKE